MPDGYTIKSCGITKGNVPNNSDGILINNDGEGTCTGFNSYRGDGTTVRGVCSLAVQEENPCNGPRLPLLVYQASRDPAPRAACPGGYEMIGCVYHSFWSPGISGGARAKISHDGQVEFGDNTCSLPNCGVNHCTTTAICQLTDTEEYRLSHCADCEGYQCGDQEECVMDGDRPSCRTIQTGCDNHERCGTYGVCAPVGADDYTCVCDEGYQLHHDTNNNLKTCVPLNTVWTIVYGEAIRAKDARSTAECPQEQKVMRCMTYGVPTASDGAHIESSSTVCVSQSSRNLPHSIQAVAYCGPVSVAKDPCSEFEIGSYEYRFDTGHSPSVECPKGYLPNSCSVYSPWMDSIGEDARSKIDSIGSVHMDDDGICSLPDCVQGDEHWCRLSLICQKLAGDEYISRACPTCDEMRCDDDEECTMSNNGLPQCSPVILGACELNQDRCGAGECIEVNGTDYTCHCKDGYVFNGEICGDIDECSDMPCGNGNCTNLPGSYSCECMDGYEFANGRCEDVDECLVINQCNPDFYVCNNIEGGYTCDCHDAFEQDAAGQCHCASGYTPHQGECVDIDECEDESTCSESEDCQNTAGGYHCTCKDGYLTDPDSGACVPEEEWDECEINPEPNHVRAVRDSSFTIWFSGMTKKDVKNRATIVWTKDGEPYDPAIDGKEVTTRGFQISAFKPEDAGIYEVTMKIETNTRKEKCSATTVVEMIEGSATVNIENRESLSQDKAAGRPFSIICDLELVNIDLPNEGDPDNVDWYKLTPGELPTKLTEETHGEIFGFNKRKGTYRLNFKDPAVSDSGTYRCRFNKFGAENSADVTINVV